MKVVAQGAAVLWAAWFCFLGAIFAQAPEVRRAQPVEETPPPQRAQPPEEPSAPPVDPEALQKRQLEYANALFTRKLYDLAIPEYQKYLDDYPGASGRPNAYFSLGECYRNLNKASSARTNFQRVLNDY